LRIVSRLRILAVVFAAAVDATHQAPPAPAIAPALAPADAPAALVGLNPRLRGGVGLRYTENRQRADRKGAEPLENPSPRRSGCHPLRYIVERSRVHVEPPLQVKTDTHRPGERREVGHGVRTIWRTTPTDHRVNNTPIHWHDALSIARASSA
jgi:hypothetical protein